MSRSKPVNFRAPNPVIDAIKLRMKRKEYGCYETLSEFQTGQNRYACFFPREHLFTAALARMPTADQDRVDDFGLLLAKAGVLLADLTDEKPITAPTVLKLAREWTAEKLAKRTRA